MRGWLRTFAVLPEQCPQQAASTHFSGTQELSIHFSGIQELSSGLQGHLYSCAHTHN